MIPILFIRPEPEISFPRLNFFLSAGPHDGKIMRQKSRFAFLPQKSSYSNSEVQWGQRVASASISDLQ